MAVSVTPIPATKSRFASTNDKATTTRRVAGYARVSTDKDEQFTSFEAQVDYYTRYIKEHSDWSFVDVYTDEGVSGTSTKHRAGFTRMIEDAKNGKIDLIITKSLSRFARNTVDTLTTIRDLKSRNVECYFEKENIWTFDSKGELLLTIMSSLAESESKSLSDNIRWAVSKKFEQGKFSLPYKCFLGYDRGPNGEPVINEKEAETVRFIYSNYLKGFSPEAIAGLLTSKGIPTPSGKSKEWCANSVTRILSNEKYAGNAILQKTFCQDFLNKKIVKNTGQMTQYHVKGSHPAIITEEMYDLVQEELKKRKASQRRHYSASIFTSRIFCGECGRVYGSKVQHSNDKYRRVVYMCNGKYADKSHFCTTPFLTEAQIKESFVKAINKLESHKNEVIGNIEELKSTVLATDALQTELDRLDIEIEVLKDKWTRLCSSGPLTESTKATRLEAEYTQALKKRDDLKEDIRSKTVRKYKLDKFIDDFKKMDGQLAEFSEELWLTLLDHVTVHTDGRLEFMFRDGESVMV